MKKWFITAIKVVAGTESAGGEPLRKRSEQTPQMEEKS